MRTEFLLSSVESELRFIQYSNRVRQDELFSLGLTSVYMFINSLIISNSRSASILYGVTPWLLRGKNMWRRKECVPALRTKSCSLTTSIAPKAIQSGYNIQILACLISNSPPQTRTPGFSNWFLLSLTTPL